MLPWGAQRFRTQGFLIVLASLVMVLLAGMLVVDAWRSTRETLTTDARQQCTAAVGELQVQFSDRATLGDADEEASASFEAQDVSLRGLSAAVLRSYEGIEGGFLLGSGQRMAGHHSGSFTLSPQSELESEARLVLDIGRQARSRGGEAAGVADDTNDRLVACAMAVPGHDAVAWVLKRLSGANDPAAERRRWWLAGIVISAALGLAMVVSTSMRLQRGVESLNAGLSQLEHDFDYRLPPIGGDFGVVAHAINRMADRRGALETTFRRQDRLAALGKVVAGVAHEIRNPLNALRLTLELLDRRARRGVPSHEQIQQALEEVDRLDQILGRLLAFGRPGVENRRHQDVRPLLERTLRIVSDRSERKAVTVVVTGHHAPAEADVDAVAFEQILINLLTNAIDASPEGGTVTVSLDDEGQDLRIAVADQGAGIRGEAQAQVFNPYFTTKEKGTGLGLAVSREIAGHHGGSLDFMSSADGTMFVLKLPRRPEHA